MMQAMSEVITENPNDFRNLSCKCPSVHCNSNAIHDWVHAKCGYKSEINSKAEIRCVHHTETLDSILNWRFDCGEHNNEYRPVDPDNLMLALASLMRQTSDMAERSWCNKLKESLMAILMNNQKSHCMNAKSSF